MMWIDNKYSFSGGLLVGAQSISCYTIPLTPGVVANVDKSNGPKGQFKFDNAHVHSIR